MGFGVEPALRRVESGRFCGSKEGGRGGKSRDGGRPARSRATPHAARIFLVRGMAMLAAFSLPGCRPSAGEHRLEIVDAAVVLQSVAADRFEFENIARV
ncbi:hypothetical protein [Burkholderia thailandensis]|uniref:hypothetical protein n=1 Tax=Burkholderia thailandensis TaxID=57975 RepID=UPI00076AD106|nr:hypothetical protein [Burkholderia thailandensis]MCS6494269.1 hypothetical protein [Burkholderia thailandensis]